MPAPEPYSAEECFQLDDIGIWRDPAIISQNATRVLAKNNVVLEYRAILVGTIRDGFPTTAVTEKATDFRFDQRRRGKRNPIHCVDTGHTLEINPNTRKFRRSRGQPIN
ncbi:mlr5662 [Mesorhizobium japonicum MAFF 303099]|uniref:Mlr5662 protein n=1 Tax=Mesorhizobium japonicum (strain LMG 29417 / CECT 9101 / MAFF 303099) TaxID=266835 RepID=Q98BA3_RHILO|nr:mlr5662 [Mesorhizobium japonicum MAFF 303099]